MAARKRRQLIPFGDPQHTMACALPGKNGQPRTGTARGAKAHYDAGEQSCPSCRAANSQRVNRYSASERGQRVRAEWLNSESGKAATERSAKQRRERLAQPRAPLGHADHQMVCAQPGRDGDPRTGTCAGYVAHHLNGEQACASCVAALRRYHRERRASNPEARKASDRKYSQSEKGRATRARAEAKRRAKRQERRQQIEARKKLADVKRRAAGGATTEEIWDRVRDERRVRMESARRSVR